MSTTKKFPLKSAVLMIGVALSAMLSACQSPKATTVQTQTALPSTVISPSAQQMFENRGQSPAYTAKAQLINALKESLTNERYTLTEIYTQSVPLYHKDSHEAKSQSIWSSVMKVSEYRRNKESSRYATEAYQSEYDYLTTSSADGATGDLPYLRYDDELAGRTPNTVTRQEAYSQDYQNTQHQIAIWQRDVDDCATSANAKISALMVELVLGEAGKDIDTNDVKQALKNLQSCKTSVDKAGKALSKTAQGYQLEEIAQTKACLGKYQKNLKAITGMNQDSLESISDVSATAYQDFKVCQQQQSINKELSPLEYTQKQHSKVVLDNLTAIKACALTAEAEKNALADKPYKDHIDEHEQINNRYIACAVGVLEKDSTIQAEDLADDMSVSRSRVDHYINYQVDDYWYPSSKYRGLSGWLKAYREMQTTNQSDDKHDDEETEVMKRFGFFGGMVASVLDHAKKTPEQLHASNLYQYNHSKLTKLSYHSPQAGQVNVLWSLDFESPTARQNAKVPMQLDFERGILRTDVSALLPIYALIDPRNAPLPQEVNDGRVLFKLPEELSQKIPSKVIYHAINQGIISGFTELPSERFTPVAMGQDNFAKEVGATTVIKFDLGTKELGKFVAHVSKTVAAELKRYVDDNPQLYPDTLATETDKDKGIKKGDSQADKVKRLIDDFATLSTAYRGSDLGGLAQGVEGFVPFELDNVMYVYLDKDGKLIASQTVSSLNDDLRDVQLQNVTQSYYSQDKVKNHPLAGEFTTFGDHSFMDGGQWIKDKWEEKKFLREARFARYDYAYSDDEGDDKEESVAQSACKNPRDDSRPVPKATDLTIGDEQAQATIDAYLQNECPN